MVGMVGTRNRVEGLIGATMPHSELERENLPKKKKKEQERERDRGDECN